MGMCKCVKCGKYFDSRDDAGDTLYPGYNGDSWACWACHEKEHEKQDEPMTTPSFDTGRVEG